MLDMLQLDLQQTRIISLQMKTQSALTRRLWCQLFVDILVAGATLARWKQENHRRRGHSHPVVELRQSKESRRRVQEEEERGAAGEMGQ